MEKMEQASLKILGPCPPDLKESVLDIRLSDGFVSRTTLIRPVSKSPSSELGDSAAPTKCPLIIFIHGGSFALCSPDMLRSPGRASASHFNAIVACIAYKLAPEHPFPAPVQSAWEVTAWLSEPENLNKLLKDEQLEYDPSRWFILAGASAGANFAAAIAGVNSMAQTDHHDKLVQGLPRIASDITGLFVTLPYLADRENIPNGYLSLFRSREEHADAPFINAKSLAETAIIYKQDLRSPWFSPLNLDLAKIRDHHPRKAFVQCGELDILRDDAVIYERILRDQAVADTKMGVLEGYYHACWCNLIFDQAHTPEVKERTMDGMAWLLGLDWDGNVALSH